MVNRFMMQKTVISHQYRMIAVMGGHPSAGIIRMITYFLQFENAALSRKGLEDGRGDWMVRLVFSGSGELQNLVRGITVFAHHIDHFKDTFCQRSGLIEDHGFYLGQRIEKIGPLHQDAAS